MLFLSLKIGHPGIKFTIITQGNQRMQSFEGFVGTQGEGP